MTPPRKARRAARRERAKQLLLTLRLLGGTSEQVAKLEKRQLGSHHLDDIWRAIHERRRS